MSLNTEPNRVLHAVAPRTPAVCIFLSGTRFTRSGQCILRRRSAIVECRVTRKASVFSPPEPVWILEPMKTREASRPPSVRKTKLGVEIYDSRCTTRDS
jgi:hypothetical protein